MDTNSTRHGGRGEENDPRMNTKEAGVGRRRWRSFRHPLIMRPMRNQQDGEPGSGAPPTLDYAGRLPRYRSVSSVALASLLAAVLGPPLIVLANFTLADPSVLSWFNFLVVAANVVLPIAAIVDVRLGAGSLTGTGLAILSPFIFVGWFLIGAVVAFYSFHGC